MKQAIHPEYFPEAKVVCACGNTFSLGSTKSEIHIEICNHCHPYFTGKEKFVDTEGRVERFQRLTTQSAEKKQNQKKKEALKPREEEKPRTLKEMLQQLNK